MISKKEARKKQIERLTKFASTEQKIQEDKILTNKFLNHPLTIKANKIGITFSMPLEVNTNTIIEQLWQMKKEVYIPRVLPQRQMEFTLYEPNTKLTKSKFGVYENWEENVKLSSNLDLLVVPGLAFSLDNKSRLGFGGGYYDRYLARHDLTTIALVNSRQKFTQATWPVEEFDISLKNLIIS